MKIEIVDGKPKLYTKCSGRIDTIKDLIEAYYWKMRCYRHERWINLSKFLIKSLALFLLKRSNIYYSHIKRYKEEPYIKKLDKTYESKCFRKLNGEYVTDIRYYTMEMKVAEYTFWGNSEYEIYLDLINRFIGQFQYPFCVKGGILGIIGRAWRKK